MIPAAVAYALFAEARRDALNRGRTSRERLLAESRARRTTTPPRHWGEMS